MLTLRALSLIVILSLACKAELSAQLSHIGILGGLTLSDQIFRHTTEGKLKRNPVLGFNGSLYTEWGYHDVFTFVSELQYDRKGSAPREPHLTTPDHINLSKSLLQMISWNNYAKFRLDWYDGSPYALAGPRIEYIFSATPYPSGPLVISGSVGLGYELNIWEPWIPFVELHYVPSFIKSYTDTTGGIEKIRESAFELKIGIKYRRKGAGSFDECPPVYL